MLPINDLKMSIIGSNGRMGQMMARKLKNKVETLNLIDLRPGAKELNDEDLKTTIPESDLVLLAVPAANLESVLKKVSRFLRFDTVLSDITSVKILPMQLMDKYHPGPVIGTHPLFGPGASPTGASPVPCEGQSVETTKVSKTELERKKKAEPLPEQTKPEPESAQDQPEQAKPEAESSQTQREETNPELESTQKQPECAFDNELRNVALVRGIHAQYEDLKLLESLFFYMGFKTFETTAKEHDQAIAIIQALNFLSNLAYFSTASKLPNLEKYVTPSFKRRLASAQKMLLEDAELFTGIARSIPELNMAVGEYLSALQSVANLDQSNIDKMLQMARKYYDQLPY